MKSFNKFLWIMVGFVACGAISFIVVTFYNRSSQNEIPQTKQSTQYSTDSKVVEKKQITHINARLVGKTDIPGFKTFTNQKYGFSISFPNTFNTSDGANDFVFHKQEGLLIDGTPNILTSQDAEYFQFTTPKEVAGMMAFGINFSSTTITQSLIDSWGDEVSYSRQTVINGKPVWALVMCAGNGCSTSFYFKHQDGTLTVTFYSTLTSTNESDLFISKSGRQILDTLQF
jgi:hypothetical protein